MLKRSVLFWDIMQRRVAIVITTQCHVISQNSTDLKINIKNMLLYYDMKMVTDSWNQGTICSRLGHLKNTYILVGRPQRKRTHGRHLYRWQSNMKINFNKP
jgi:hypothetical protein